MERVPHSEMADRLASMAWSKQTWLTDHGPKRSPVEFEQRRRELEALQQAASDYRRAAQRGTDNAKSA